jgi:Uroporphyrinogen decarboxylase (URO-D)
MPESVTPRQVVQAFLQGAAPPRPLFLPIVFAHGARIENVSLRVFLTNPTKISNSLRQIRARLGADGVMCYFEPGLEAEALGATVQWDGDDRPPTFRWPRPGSAGELPEGLRSPEDAAKYGRVGIAVEVIRRMKSILRDDCLLMAAVSGPFTLAAMLTQVGGHDTLRAQDISASALDLATAAISPIAKALLEAGAGAVFIREEVLPALSADEASDWAARLATTINIVRFYQALPVLLLPRASSAAENRESIVEQSWDCVVCPALDPAGAGPEWPAGFGAALPLEAFEPGDSGSATLDESVRRMISGPRPSVVTTAGDVPAAADMERLKKVWENARSR